MMSGGLGSRMGGVEKLMIMLGGKSFVERVADALKESGSFSRIVSAVSPNTPQTKQLLTSLGIEVIDTLGAGYSQDLSLLLSTLAPDRVLIVSADLPLLTAETVREVAKKLSSHNAPAVSAVMDRSFVESLGMMPSVVIGDKCHSGITLFDAGQVSDKPVKELYVTMNMKEIAVNVNTKKEKEMAELLLVQHAKDLARDEGL